MPDHPLDIRLFKEALEHNYALVLTSNSVEKTAVNRVIAPQQHAIIPQSNRGCVLGLIDSMFALHVTGESGGSREHSIGRIVRAFLVHPEMPKPGVVLLVGFCWGTPNKAGLGHVILADRIHSLNRQDLRAGTEERRELIYSSRLQVSEELETAIKASLKAEDIKVQVGPLASLEAHFASADARDQFLAAHPGLVGGEMEAYDFVPDCALYHGSLSKRCPTQRQDKSGNQVLAANNSARVILPLLQHLRELKMIPEPECGPSADRLRDMLEGGTILISAKQVCAYSLNDYLNNVIGPSVAFKLLAHSSDLEYGKSFPDIFCDLLLEIGQNAFRHGNATEVEITFSEDRITIEDNGSLFALESLEGNRGGALAWRRAKGTFIDNGDISFTARKPTRCYKNRYFFQLKKVDKILQHAKEHCNASIISKTIRAPMGAPNILKFNPQCEVIYLNAPVRMTSRVLDIAGSVRTLIAAGKTVLIGCSSESQVLRFKEALRDIEPARLRIFVEGS